MLPLITKDLVHSVLKSMKEEDFVEDGWVDMLFKNPELFSSIVSYSKLLHLKSSQEAFLRGAFLAWVLLYKQDEVNDMNENWGV
tara:strand:- start:55 stop:306 length:252 start_codon:yes stop_codon:yes gene_type:complete